jgi:hypothetical protein
MRFLLIAATGILCAILAGALAGFVGECYTRWFHVSQREGGAGYLVAFLILLGGIAGLITGIAAGAANDAFLPGLGWGSGIVVSVASVIFALCYLLGDIPPTSGWFERLVLVAEIRTPEGAKLTNRMKANGASTGLTLIRADGSDGHSSHDHSNWTEEGVLTTRMNIFASKGRWKIEVWVNSDQVAVFPELDLGPMRPGKEWSAWKVSDKGYRLRYRVALASEDSRATPLVADAPLQPVPALDPKGRLEDWLRFLDEYYKAPREKYTDQAAADQLQMRTMDVIRSRPEDVIQLLQAAGPGNMHLSMLAVQSLEVPESFGGPLRKILPRFEEAVRVYLKESPAGDPDILRAQKLKDDFQVWCNLWERFQAYHPDTERPNLDGLEKVAGAAPEEDPIHDLVGHIGNFREYTLKRN